MVTRTINYLDIKSPSSEHGTISNNLAYGCMDAVQSSISHTMVDAVCGGKLYHFCAMWGDVCSIAITTANNTNWPLQHITFKILPHLFVLFNSIRLCHVVDCALMCRKSASTQKAWQISWCCWCEHHKWMEQIKSSKSDGAMSVTKYAARVLGRCAIKIILGFRIASSRLAGASQIEYTRAIWACYI